MKIVENSASALQAKNNRHRKGTVKKMAFVRPPGQIVPRNSSNEIHIISRGNSWVLKKDGAFRVLGIFKDRDQAYAEAEEMLKNSPSISGIVVHARNGMIVFEKIR